jgi:hypothetical protein
MTWRRLKCVKNQLKQMIRKVWYKRMRKDNRGMTKENFEKEWLEYIFAFEDNVPEKEEWNISDRDLEGFLYGCDMSTPYLSELDKLKVKRYRRENCKR